MRKTIFFSIPSYISFPLPIGTRFDIIGAMAKKLRIRDKLLLGLALAGDLYFEIFEPYGLQVKKMRGILPSDYKASNFANAMSRLLRTDQIERIVKNGEPYLRLSSQGKKTMIRDFSIFKFAQKPWDHFWRIVFYDIPEEQRKIRVGLQRKLVELGFGKLQESAYVSAFDLAEDIREYVLVHNLGDWVFVSVSKRLFAGNEKALAEKVWRLTELNQRYKDWLESLEEKNEKEGLSIAYTSFLEIIKDDPCLPKELLPTDWLGEKARRKAKRVASILLQ